MCGGGLLALSVCVGARQQLDCWRVRLCFRDQRRGSFSQTLQATFGLLTLNCTDSVCLQFCCDFVRLLPGHPALKTCSAHIVESNGAPGACLLPRCVFFFHWLLRLKTSDTDVCLCTQATHVLRCVLPRVRNALETDCTCVGRVCCVVGASSCSRQSIQPTCVYHIASANFRPGTHGCQGLPSPSVWPYRG